MGGYLCHVGADVLDAQSAKNVVSVFARRLVEIDSRRCSQITSRMGPYDGAGAPGANYVMSGLIDTASAEMGIDRSPLRRRNHIKPAHDALRDRRREAL